MEMEELKEASLETYKHRRLYTFLYASKKLTMLSTSAVNEEKLGFTLVREAVVPRTWDARASWLKLMELISCMKVRLVFTCRKSIKS